MTETIAAIIPAAGYSSRMGRFKPLLPLGDAPLIRRLLTIFQQAGLTRIQVVTGHRAAELNGQLPFPADTIHYPDYPRGMFSSILRGIAGLAPEIEAAFILPVDIPLVRAATLRQLIRRFRRSRAGLVYPVFQGQRGHPPLISRDLLICRALSRNPNWSIWRTSWSRGTGASPWSPDFCTSWRPFATIPRRLRP